ncbi:hypothetical protein PHLGIDRAFT_129265 [Phlebiopsis gigantea 11061_1 CR5-6]|uniref:Rho-GAP domain-containing protein n=1 Tax=Phlebiopsis gigantea (strain 11061_1 CR5-6) TaxID=745531 RepID=A0A0C3RUS3_PHLG1|nr:hypothetical protein PHLGIDRAFT_129265 [Phlebiopsis gigantea 11061_1 CR5-6]
MADAVEDAVRRLLRSSEELKQFLEAEAVPPYTDGGEPGSEPQIDPPVANNEPGVMAPYPWIVPYITQTKPSILFYEPQDLRHARRPLYDLLSESCAGTPGDDALDISLVREHWTRSQVEDMYATEESITLRLRIGTFNVNGKMPSQDLSSWVRGQAQDTTDNFIPPLKAISPFSISELTINPLDQAGALSSNVESSSSNGVRDPALAKSRILGNVAVPSTTGEAQDPDLIVLGFQELDLSAGALIYSTETTREDAWFAAALAGLGENAVEYEKLASKQLVGMLVMIIVRRSVKGNFTRVQGTSIGAGIMGLMGNKGAAALRVTFNPSSTQNASSLPLRPIVLTFVNAHLAAFDEMFEKRNADFHDISRRLVFDSGVPATGAASPQFGYTPPTVPLNVYQSDALFWMGALSDKLGYDLKRKPAWTDRILHIPSHAVQVLQQTYTCHREITMSDHRPVSATFELHIPTVDAEKLEAFVHGLWKEVSHVEESGDIPRVTVEPTVINLGKIGYERRVRKLVRVRNTGRVPLVYRFVPLSPGGSIHPDWLHVEPKAGLIRPGSHEELTLSVEVDAQLAAQMNLRASTLETTLVLHASLGRDSFLVVTAEYEPTCFAMSIPRLVRMSGPVGTHAALQLVPEDQAATAPKEVMRLVSWLMTYGSDVNELFLAHGDPEKMDDIRRALDVGEELSEPNEDIRATMALSVGSCLIQFMEALPEPLVPVNLHHACADSLDRDAAFELLARFPSAAVNVFLSITSLLHFICQQGSHSTDSVRAQKLGTLPIPVQMCKDADSRFSADLAAVFAPVFLRDLPPLTPAISPVGKRRFVLHFISDS